MIKAMIQLGSENQEAICWLFSSSPLSWFPYLVMISSLVCISSNRSSLASLIAWKYIKKGKYYLPNAGKHATVTKRGKTCNRYQARENMQPVPSVGKQATGSKCGKTWCNRFQAQENIQPVQSAGKHATGTKRGKTYSRRCQAREKM